ncbi:MAG TPA: hypothetical protein VGS22_14130 [Thermoanaerobaculia bacterium]|jgi:hypothetical protein|nr:hypothetical protein [Thermoanaerobaculia bacterium]
MPTPTPNTPNDRLAAAALVAVTALPAALVAVPAAAAIWIVCGNWTRGTAALDRLLRAPERE